MQTFRRAALTAALLLAAGCGGESEVTVTDDDSGARDAAETPVADALREPMDKAAAVEDVAMQRKDEMDKRLAEMEGEVTDDEDP